MADEGRDGTAQGAIPRRARLGQLTPAERAIHDAVRAVENLPADVRLTDAVILLQQARERVADYYDNPNTPPVSASQLKRENVAQGKPMMDGVEQLRTEQRQEAVMEQPSVGRIVHFVEARHDRVGHRAAVITQVNASDVHLTVWSPYEDYRLEYVRYDANRAPGTWHFPERVS
jgi:hypothetical protein